MGVRGLMNMQYAICEGVVYVLEANPRASRTVPLVSKVCGINMVQLATEIITDELTGRPSPVPALKEKAFRHCGVKEAVFPINMFQEVDPILGPEMRSTGEVLGLAGTFGEAFFKAEEATQTRLPLSGTVLMSVNDHDKAEILPVARGFSDIGFQIIATGGTYWWLKANGVECSKINKLYEGSPNIADLLADGKVDIVINTPMDKQGAFDDSYIRKAAIKGRLPYVTTMAAARATLSGIRCMKQGSQGELKSLQQYHSEISDKE